MTTKISLDCGWCGIRAESSGATSTRRCERCDGPLKVTTDLSAVRRDRLRDAALPGLWAWFDFLPVSDRGAIVSLAEGNTPLIHSDRLGSNLLLKDETRNPTGSFKDRMLAVGVARAIEFGQRTVAVQSSGNVGAAAAAYAARAGLRAIVFVPRTAPAEKILQAQMYGARVVRIDESSPAAIFDLLLWACDEFDWYLVSTAAIYNPFTLEGAKTIAYEIAEQTGFDLPDWLIVPVGGGGTIGTLWRGFRDLQALGLIDRLPRMIGVQSAGCAPLVDAIRHNRSPQEALVSRWPHIDTVAGAIADDVVFDAHIALPAIRESGGRAVAVSDESTLSAQAALATAEGIFVEPAAATTIAAAKMLAGEGVVGRDDRVMCLLTGHGLKDPGAARRHVTPPELIPLDRDAVARATR
jgi:threonine synthase